MLCSYKQNNLSGHLTVYRTPRRVLRGHSIMLSGRGRDRPIPTTRSDLFVEVCRGICEYLQRENGMMFQTSLREEELCQGLKKWGFETKPRKLTFLTVKCERRTRSIFDRNSRNVEPEFFCFFFRERVFFKFKIPESNRILF